MGNTTTTPASAMPDWPGHSGAFDRLSCGIDRLYDLSRVQEVLTAQLLSLKTAPQLCGDEKAAVEFIASEIRTEAGNLSELYEGLQKAEPNPYAGEDPLLEAVTRFTTKRTAHSLDRETPESEAMYQRNVEPCWKRLSIGDLRATTATGAAAALKLAIEEQKGGESLLTEPLIRGALAFLETEGRA